MTIALFQSEVREQVLRDVLGHNPKWKNEIYVVGTARSIARLDVWVATVRGFSAERQKRIVHRLK